MISSTDSTPRSPGETQLRLHQHGRVVQNFDQLREMPLGLPDEARAEIAALLNKLLSDARVLHDLYKKSHWLMRGATFYQLHLLMDKPASEQEELVDTLAERVQTLGAVAVGDPRHVAELTSVPRPPDGAEEVPAMLSRLLEAHELVIGEVREAAHAPTRSATTAPTTSSSRRRCAQTSCRPGSWPSSSWTPRS